MNKLLTLFGLLAFLTLASCGSGGAPLGGLAGPSGSGGTTGEVTLSIKDAPLSALQSFTIDVSSAVLKGAGATSDFPLFPATSTSSAPVTIDLLAVQGFNRLLASQQVPTGAYHSIELAYSNPQAIDNQNVAQNITTTGSTVYGVFSPPLVVSTNSQQSVQVDVDLQSSVFDLGGNNMLFSAVVKVDVLNQARPVKRFPAVVISTNSANDSFEADLVFYGPNAPSAGRLRVQCSNLTTFNDGHGNISAGNVAARLSASDLVEIDGSLLHSTVTASAVTLLGRATVVSGGNSNPGSIQHAPILGPPVHLFAGTLIGVNSLGGSIDILTRASFGPNGPTSTNMQSQIETLAVDVNTKIHRGPTATTLADLVLGNWVEVIGGTLQNQRVAQDLDEGPAFVSGVVDSIAVGGGANGSDRIAFVPHSVDQTPAANLPFLPALVEVDLMTPHGFAVNSRIQAIGFFVANSSLLDVRGGRGGVHNGNAGGQGGAVSGSNGQPGGVTHPLPAPTKFAFFGEVAANSSAVINGNGALEVTLQVGPQAGAANRTLDVVIPASTQIMRTSFVGNQIQHQAISHVDAQNDLNSGNFALEAIGSAAPTNGVFTADLGANLSDRNATNTPPSAGHLPGLPRPFPTPGSTGGGNAGGGNSNPGGGNAGGGNGNPGGGNAGGGNGNPGGGNAGGGNGNPGGGNAGSPPIPTPQNVIVGTVAGVATAATNGDVNFALSMPSGAGVSGGRVQVTINANTRMILFDRGLGSAGGPNSQAHPKSLTLQECLAALNANPTNVQATGRLDFQHMTMNPTLELVIFK